jgi:hypothetical protein
MAMTTGTRSTVCWTGMFTLAAALTAGSATVWADTPTVHEMDQYVAKMAAQDLEILANLVPKELWVAPNGKPTNSGAKRSPLDLKTAYTNPKLVTPGTIVWITGGTYEIGDLQPEGVCGTREKPIIFRAVPGTRATINGQIQSKAGCNHIWWWGVEVTGPVGSGVETREGGDGLKFINMVIHDKHSVQPPEERKPTAMGVGGWDTGDDHEFYGSIVYRNGWNTLDHGFYSQNTAEHTAKRYVDNLVFENAGLGFQIYGSSPALRNIFFAGNASFATGLLPHAPEIAEKPQQNVIIGGHQPLTCVIARDNCTYHPSPNAKRGMDIGYTGKPNCEILVENNYLMCGLNAFELQGVGDAVVRNNTFWAPEGMVAVSFASAEAMKGQGTPKVVFEKNTYIDNGRFDLAAFQTFINSGQTDRLVKGRDGRPSERYVFKRVNRYEPQRVHLAVYNWPKTPTAPLDLSDVLKTGQKYRIVEVHDIWGQPVLEGTFDGQPIEIKMSGPYAPEFGCYMLFRAGVTVLSSSAVLR